MPGEHKNKNLEFVGFRCSPALASQIDEKARHGRSQFVREAVEEKLARLGVHLERQHVDAKSRKGKGGPKRKTQISSKATDAAHNLARKAVDDLGAEPPKH